MSYVPKNVRDTAAKNDLYAKLEKEQALATRHAIITQWAERDLKRDPPNSLRGATMTLQRTAAERDAGVKSGLETVKVARQARLKELFEQEALMYEEELNSMGLALNKARE